jgi:hypothetical protein
MPDGTLILTDGKTGRDDDDYETELQMAACTVMMLTAFSARVSSGASLHPST